MNPHNMHQIFLLCFIYLASSFSFSLRLLSIEPARDGQKTLAPIVQSGLLLGIISIAESFAPRKMCVGPHHRKRVRQFQLDIAYLLLKDLLSFVHIITPVFLHCIGQFLAAQKFQDCCPGNIIKISDLQMTLPAYIFCQSLFLFWGLRALWKVERITRRSNFQLTMLFTFLYGSLVTQSGIFVRSVHTQEPHIDHCSLVWGTDVPSHVVPTKGLWRMPFFPALRYYQNVPCLMKWVGGTSYWLGLRSRHCLEGTGYCWVLLPSTKSMLVRRQFHPWDFSILVAASMPLMAFLRQVPSSAATLVMIYWQLCRQSSRPTALAEMGSPLQCVSHWRRASNLPCGASDTHCTEFQPSHQALHDYGQHSLAESCNDKRYVWIPGKEKTYLPIFSWKSKITCLCPFLALA